MGLFPVVRRQQSKGDKRRVDIREVRPAIERLHVERPDDAVVIIADRESNTGMLTQVMDQVKLGGVSEVSIATAPVAS